MGNLIDLTGQRFGRWTVIERAENSNDGKGRWLCQCDCGNRRVVKGEHLRGSLSLSCGCFKRELIAKRSHKLNATHGLSNTRLHKIWRGMKDRCCRPKNPAYPRYGGRGITVCDEWLHNFQAFWDWAIANGYRDDLSIDRIDNNKGYSPDNCRWATVKEQANNLRTNHFITFGGQTLTLAQWREKQGITKGQYDSRIKRGWTPEEALGLIPRKK